jgi:proline racemase
MAQFKHIISTIDSHTAGEPTRLVVGGLPPLQGVNMEEKMMYARNHLDGLRALLLIEPRGRQDMYGAVLTTATNPLADYGLIFMNTQHYTTMCGHAVIGASTTLVETGMVTVTEPETIVTFDTPVGLVSTRVKVTAGRVIEVSFDNTPVFAFQLDAHISVPDLGDVSVDVAYSGGFFALVNAQKIGLEIDNANVEALLNMGMRIRDAAQSQLAVSHPDLAFTNLIDCVEFCGPTKRLDDGSLYARNTVILGNRTMDRSPCGTGTCAKMAVLHAKGELKVNEKFISESIIQTRFVGQIIGETHVGEIKAVLPRVTGRAYITGFHQFVLDPDDPFQRGFNLSESNK